MYLVTSYDKEHNPDFIADFTLCILWSEIEANVAMMVCCMPTLGPVLGKLRRKLVPLVPSPRIRRWVLLSSQRQDSKFSKNDMESSIAATSNTTHPANNPSRHIAPWPEPPRTVTAASYSDTEQSDHSRGIFTRTEISRTIEGKGQQLPPV
jgi:hypothetical protein